MHVSKMFLIFTRGEFSKRQKFSPNHDLCRLLTEDNVKHPWNTITWWDLLVGFLNMSERDELIKCIVQAS